MIFIPDKNIEWVEVPMIKDDWRYPISETNTYQYRFILPRPLADWDVFDYWEKPRLDSMKAHLNYGETLFDIGTEQGWCNLIYASFVGPENMVLIEPTFEFWANIKKTWDKNYDVPPLACYWGLFDSKTRDDYDKGFDIWAKADAEQIIDRNKYQYIHESESKTTHIELDKYVTETGIVPDAITCDTEGSELLIFKGAEKTLKEHHPQIWVSVHDELAKRDYGVEPGVFIDYLKSLGYKHEHLSVDHESHERFYYEPNGT